MAKFLIGDRLCRWSTEDLTLRLDADAWKQISQKRAKHDKTRPWSPEYIKVGTSCHASQNFSFHART
jgi:hypothetical protein